jgi:superfamily II DNA or RNA helicase
MSSAPDDLDLSTVPRKRWKSLLDDLASFPSHIRERGARYAAEGRVGLLVVSDLEVSAVVRGSADYRTAWAWDRELWLPECTCPAGPYCKHAYALACTVLVRVRDEVGLLDRRIAGLLPLSVPRPPAGMTTLPAAESVASRAAPPRRGAPRTPAQAVARPAAATGARELLRAASSWQRAIALERMLHDPRAATIDPFAPPFPDLLAEPDPELMCWMLAQEIPLWTGGWLPAAFEPFRTRTDLEARHAERALPAAEQALLRWAAERATVPPRSLRMVFALEVNSRGDVTLTTQVRVRSPRLDDEPRTLHQLVQLETELRRKPWLLTEEEASIVRAAIELQDAAWGGVTRGAAGAGLAPLLRRIGDSSRVTWDPSLPEELARRAGVSPGAGVRLSPQLLRLLPACEEVEGEPRVVLRLVWPDGRHRPFGETLHFRPRDAYGGARPGLVLCDGLFYELLEQPPDELVDLLQRSGGLVVRRETRERMLAQLAEGFPSMRASLAGHIRYHDVTAAVALDLREDDWLQIRLMAHDAGPDWRPGTALEAPATLFEYTPARRWERVPGGATTAVPAPVGLEPVAADASDRPASEGAAPPAGPGAAAVEAVPAPAPAAAWLEAPRPERVEPAVAWLRATGARAGGVRGPGGMGPAAPDAETGWWVRLNARSTSALATAWEERPADVAWFGNPAVRRLLGPAAVARPKLHVRSSGVDWFVMSAEWEAEGRALTDEDLARLRAASTRWVKLSSGWARRDEAEIHDRAAEVLADLGIEPGGGDQRVTLWQLAAARPESLAALERLGADPEATRAIHRLRERIASFRGLPRCPVPAGFTGELRAYQRQGLDFLAWNSSLGLGAVLADDMGLGKTIQALAWVRHLRERDPKSGPCLVVCPTSVMHNWERETARFTPDLRVLVLGKGGGRHSLRREIPRHDLLITNYALLRRDLEAWTGTRLGAVILDEAQNIKNPNTAVARAALELRAPHRLALTGTPLENRALDLWSIMSFVNPGYLGPRTRFAARYDRLDAPPHTRALLAARLRPVMLRRLKRDVATDLPERIEERRDCELTRGQRQLYVVELQRSRNIVAQLALDPMGLQRNKISILAALTRLRQICCHPALAGGAPALGSGKFEALFELLEPIFAEGHKVLVFSQFVECLKLLAAEMTRRGVPFHMLTGQTTRREQVVDAFQADARPCAFLVSLKAGGTGLNLTAASYVVLFDPWWNPAVESQAIDRTHRIGQDRTVIAYRMLAEGTIEERIWELQQRKAALVKDVLGEDGFARTLGREDLEYLLAEA